MGQGICCKVICGGSIMLGGFMRENMVRFSLPVHLVDSRSNPEYKKKNHNRVKVSKFLSAGTMVDIFTVKCALGAAQHKNDINWACKQRVALELSWLSFNLVPNYAPATTMQTRNPVLRTEYLLMIGVHLLPPMIFDPNSSAIGNFNKL
jgi:hypothetical protein